MKRYYNHDNCIYDVVEKRNVTDELSQEVCDQCIDILNDIYGIMVRDGYRESESLIATLRNELKKEKGARAIAEKCLAEADLQKREAIQDVLNRILLEINTLIMENEDILISWTADGKALTEPLRRLRKKVGGLYRDIIWEG